MAGDDDAGARLTAGLDQVWAWTCARAWPLAGLALVVLTVARSGMDTQRTEVFSWLYLSWTFPTPEPIWQANSYLGPGLASVLHATTIERWNAMHGAVIALAAVLAGGLVARRFRARSGRQMALVWLALGSVPPVLLQKVGSYDPFSAVGALLVVLGGHPVMAVAGGALMGATNAEQAVVGVISAAVVAVLLGPADDAAPSGWRTPGLAALGAGLVGIAVGRVAVLALFARSDVSVPGRGSVFGDLLGRSLERAVGAGAAGVGTWLGLAWGVLVLVWAGRRWSGRRFVGVVAALVAGPALATVTTLDGTRVFAMVSLPALLVVVAWVVERVEAGRLPEAFATRVTTAALLVSPLVPALVTDPFGRSQFSFPW